MRKAKVVKCHTCKKVCVGDGFTTGYGIDDKGHKICFACCGVQDYYRMLKEGKTTMYLTGAKAEMKICNWPSSLIFKPRWTKRGRHNMAGTQTHVWFDVYNELTGKFENWIGRNVGENTQILHCRRLPKHTFDLG